MTRNGAIPCEDLRIHIVEGHGGLPDMEFYNVRCEIRRKGGRRCYRASAADQVAWDPGKEMA